MTITSITTDFAEALRDRQLVWGRPFIEEADDRGGDVLMAGLEEQGR